MSQPIEDDKGFHIVRVVERTEAGRKPFLEAQVEIREKLREESIDAQKGRVHGEDQRADAGLDDVRQFDRGRRWRRRVGWQTQHRPAALT